MKENHFSPGVTPKTAKTQKSIAVDLNPSKTVPAPSPEAVARGAYSIYENEGSKPGHDIRHWLEAEAQLFGGVERESEMHPGSSLFTTEH